MQSITLSILLVFTVLTAWPSAAESGTEDTADQPSAWTQFWQGVRDDWKKIGQDAKASGTEAGRAVKEEFQEMPENFRNGFEKAKQDFKKITDSSGEPGTEH